MPNSNQLTKVMIAGIGGASLGTEISKCLKIAAKYEVLGCDVSPTAYGLYDNNFTDTFRINHDDYITNVVNVCRQTGAQWLIPGGEQPNALLASAADVLRSEGIKLVANNASVVKLFSNKQTTFSELAAQGVSIPKTRELADASDVMTVGLPCIVKPATGSGGSVAVFFATTSDEAQTYADFIRRTGNIPIAQEYIAADEGEFTIGVLSLPDGRVAGSIALRRALDAKLSVAYRGRGGLISSGYSQGYIDSFPSLCEQAERIARIIDSKGPINIQARVRNGVLIPFEINPRFSASAYLRALAGFNEIDIFLSYLISGELPARAPITTGWYLRSLTENYISSEELK